MNSRQAAAAAAKHIEKLEQYNHMAMRDIKAYNQCVVEMIEGGNPCDWCEEKRLGECEKPELDGKGCQTWWLKDMDAVAQEASDEQAAVQVEGVLPEGEKDG